MVADFSHFALWLAGLASVAHAYTQPVGDTPSGNSITKPGLNELVSAGKAYTITWTPTTAQCASVDLILLRGPAENIKYLSTIAEKVGNDGTYSWTVPSTLEPDTTHYGIQLICDESGAYQYTTQFGISNPGYSGSVSSSSDLVTSTRSVHLAYSSVVSSSSCSSSSSWHMPTSYYAAGNSTSAGPTGTIGSHSLKTTHKASTSTVIATDTPTVTDTPAASTSPVAAVTTNGAPVATAAFGLMGAAAAAAVYLL